MAKIIPIGGTTCPECEGKGWIYITSYEEGEDGFNNDCPTCDGKGYVFEESEVE